VKELALSKYSLGLNKEATSSIKVRVSASRSPSMGMASPCIWFVSPESSSSKLSHKSYNRQGWLNYLGSEGLVTQVTINHVSTSLKYSKSWVSIANDPFRNSITLVFKYRRRTAMRNIRVFRYWEKRLIGLKEACCISSASLWSASLQSIILKSDNEV